MPAKKIKQIKKLFEQAVELSPAERITFLEKECGRDNELRQTILDLLNADEHTHSIFQEDVLDLIGPDQIQSYTNKKIGPYRLIRELGSGGAGVVFLAERDDGTFEQQVAVKLLKSGMDSNEIARRFRSERQILARLQHPNIARLLDGGVTDDGLPFFAMEYVKGIPIDTYCRQHNLSVNERLKLFRKICSTVQYAHRNLLIHRDLKPANILVNDEGEIKLLDFGIAKVLSDEADGTISGAALTQTGMRVMTPLYASPEQVRGASVDTSTDIYSLGVILYKLLTGKMPYDVAAKSLKEIEQTILTADPKKPSAVAEQVALRKVLSGDLDNICLMALKKEADRRYISVEQFNEDITRYLAGHTVLARPDTFAYKTQKFIQRNKKGLTVSAAVLTGVILLTVFYAVQLTEERDKAVLEAKKSEQVTAFLRDLFKVSNPDQSKGETITARELLNRGANRIREELNEQPDVQAEMMYVIGDVDRSLGLYKSADTLLSQSLQLKRKLFGKENVEVAKTLNALGVLYEKLGRFFDAAAKQDSAVAILRNYAASHPQLLANSLHSLAHAKMRLNQLDDAERYIREALKIKQTIYGEKNAGVAYSLNILGDIFSYQGRDSEAVIIHKKVLAMRLELLGPDNLDVASTLHNMAMAQRNIGQYKEAEKNFREAARIQEKILGYYNPEEGNTLSLLASAISRQGRYKEAEKIDLEAIKNIKHVLGDKHVLYGVAWGRYGDTLMGLKKYVKAEEAYRKDLEIRRPILGNSHPAIAAAISYVGIALWKQGRYKEAEQLLQQGFNICNSNPDCGEDSYQKKFTRSSLFDFYTELGRTDEADKYR